MMKIISGVILALALASSSVEAAGDPGSGGAPLATKAQIDTLNAKLDTLATKVDATTAAISSNSIPAGSPAAPSGVVLDVQNPTGVNLHVDNTIPGPMFGAAVGSSNLAVGTAPNVTASGTSLLAKTSDGNLYGANATNLSASNVGFIVAIAAPAAPSIGTTITPVDCVPFGTTGGGISYGAGPPKAYAGGIVILLSTSCTTYTPASLSGFLSASIR